MKVNVDYSVYRKVLSLAKEEQKYSMKNRCFMEAGVKGKRELMKAIDAFQALLDGYMDGKPLPVQ
jgi:hypothetical protein